MRRTLPLALFLAIGCRTAAPDVVANPTDPTAPSQADGVNVLESSAVTKQLQDTAEKLADSQGQLDDQRRRLERICGDYPRHEVCQPQTDATYAKEAFCKEPEFTKHVDEIVDSCQQGQCKQVDDAALLSRTQYMTLVQSLPHTLVLFGNAQKTLDPKDREQLQRFIELIHAEDGYVIIVGRASHDGVWKSNLRLALDRAETTRKFIVDTLGLDEKQVGYITYGHEKMYLTAVDVARLTTRKVSPTQGNRSALVFAYPCHGPKQAQTRGAPDAPK